jgi:hypothetical protein
MPIPDTIFRGGRTTLLDLTFIVSILILLGGVFGMVIFKNFYYSIVFLIGLVLVFLLFKFTSLFNSKNKKTKKSQVHVRRFTTYQYSRPYRLSNREKSNKSVPRKTSRGMGIRDRRLRDSSEWYEVPKGVTKWRTK